MRAAARRRTSFATRSPSCASEDARSPSPSRRPARTSTMCSSTGGEDAVRALIAAASNGELYSTRMARRSAPQQRRRAQGDSRQRHPRAAPGAGVAGVLWHNEFATSTVARRPPPWAATAAGWRDTPWSDRDDYLVAEWLQQQGILVPASVPVRRWRRSPTTRPSIRCANTWRRCAGTAGRAWTPG